MASLPDEPALIARNASVTNGTVHPHNGSVERTGMRRLKMYIGIGGLILLIIILIILF